jgi:hypothetical protein
VRDSLADHAFTFRAARGGGSRRRN